MKKQKKLLTIIIGVLAFFTISNAQAFDDNKEGFILGLGVGLHHLSRDHNDITNNGIATSFKAGYGFNDSVLLYYTNDVAWFNNSEDKLVMSAFSGIGVTYFVEELDPSAYVSLAYGLGRHTQLLESDYDAWTGSGYSIGVGYELTNHLMADLSFQKSSLKRDANPGFTLKTTVSKFMMIYVFY